MDSNFGGEFDFISRIKATSRPRLPQIIADIGDDAAVLDIPGQIVVTTDMLTEGRHFRLDWLDACSVGWRATIASLSDCAAMGARPVAAFLSIGLPAGRAADLGDDLARGCLNALSTWNCTLAGGDTIQTETEVAINLAIVAKAGPRTLLRSGARPGDALLVTGHLGGARGALLAFEAGEINVQQSLPNLWRRFASPVARVEAGEFLARQSCVHTMMDLSDGLAADLRRMAEASRVGVRINLPSLPFETDLEKAVGITQEPPAHSALLGGEDFELLLAAAPASQETLRKEFEQTLGIKLTHIGSITEELSLIMVDEHGTEALLPEGFQHFL